MMIFAVAMTRPKRLLVVIGDSDTVKRCVGRPLFSVAHPTLVPCPGSSHMHDPETWFSSSSFSGPCSVTWYDPARKSLRSQVWTRLAQPRLREHMHRRASRRVMEPPLLVFPPETPAMTRSVLNPLLMRAGCVNRGSKFLKKWMDFLEENADLRYPDVSTLQS